MTDASKPKMTLPNGDIIHEGDYAITRGGQKVGPMRWEDGNPPFVWFDLGKGNWSDVGEDGTAIAPLGSQMPGDLIAKWHPVEAGPDPVEAKPKRAVFWLTNGRVFQSAREAKTAFPGSDPVKVKECRK